LILHGTKDDIIPASICEGFAKRHPNVRLRLLESGHDLTDVMETLWQEVYRFLSVG
jgi:hypothetical protein